MTIKNKTNKQETKSTISDNINERDKSPALNKKEGQRRWRERNKEHIAKYNKEYENRISDEKRKGWNKKYYYKHKWDERFRKVNAIRLRARRKVKVPEGQLCEVCKDHLAVQRHHRDYSKPLEVIFLCSACHAKEHIKLKNMEIEDAK